MIFLELFLGFLKVGCFSFGGAYAAIPLIRDIVVSYGWLSDDMLSYMIAVSESTPGPIMVNLATYVGTSQAGILGAVTATLAVVLPSFIIILLVSIALERVLKSPHFQAILRGLKPGMIGIVLATGIWITIRNISLAGGEQIKEGADLAANALFTVSVGAVFFLIKYLPVLKKIRVHASPMKLIAVSAVLGALIFSLI